MSRIAARLGAVAPVALRAPSAPAPSRNVYRMCPVQSVYYVSVLTDIHVDLYLGTFSTPNFHPTLAIYVLAPAHGRR